MPNPQYFTNVGKIDNGSLGIMSDAPISRKNIVMYVRSTNGYYSISLPNSKSKYPQIVKMSGTMTLRRFTHLSLKMLRFYWVVSLMLFLQVRNFLKAKMEQQNTQRRSKSSKTS